MMQSITDALKEISKCVGDALCTQCAVHLVPGTYALFTGTDLAWVRLVTAFPSTRFPQQYVEPNACLAAPLAYTIEVGVLRCIPSTGRAGITAAGLESTAAVLLQDMEDIKDALRCCLPEWLMVMGNWTPIGPAGNAAGGSWQIVITREYGDG